MQRKPEELKRFETNKYELEMRKVQIESFKRYSKALIENGISADVARNADDLHVKAYDMFIQASITVIEPMRINFHQMDLKEYVTRKMQGNVVGRINILDG